MEQGSVNQRLNLLVDHFEKGVKAAFARKVGISPQGAQELLAGRKGDPSFKVLVRILESYPAVNANWLVLGRGLMLRDESFTETLKEKESTDFTELVDEETSRNLIRYAMDKAGGFDSFMEAFFESMKPGLTEKIKEHYTSLEGFENENAIYRLEGESDNAFPYGGLLANRLNISETEVFELVGGGGIEYISIDKSGRPNSLRVTERAVRKFLGEV